MELGRRLVTTFPLMLVLVAAPILAQEATQSVSVSGSDEPATGVIATVNGEPIYFADLERVLADTHRGVPAGQRQAPDLDRMLFRLVNDELLGQEARALGMHEEDPIPARLAAKRTSLAVERLEREEIWTLAEPSAEEIEGAFQEEYRSISFRMLTARERDEAEKLVRELEQGADFATLAKEHSVDPYGPRGGLVEDLPRIDMPHELAAGAFAMSPGDLEGPISTRIGWTAIRVESFSDADPERLEELEPSLRALVRFRKAETLRSDLGARLRVAHPVVTDEEAVAAIVAERLPDGRLKPRVENPELQVAQVGDRTITAAELGRTLQSRWKGVRNEQAARAARPIVLARLIRTELMRAEALARGYGDSENAKRALSSYETRLLIPRLLNQVVGAGIEVTQEEMSSYYEEQKESFRKPPRLHLRQITVASEKEAEALAELLRQGADLAWLARQHSTDRYKDSGGERGWVTPGRSGDLIEAGLFEAQPGDVLGPEAVAEGYVVVQVALREEQGIYPLGEISVGQHPEGRPPAEDPAGPSRLRPDGAKPIGDHDPRRRARDVAHHRLTRRGRAVRTKRLLLVTSRLWVLAVTLGLVLSSGAAHAQLRKGARFQKGSSCTDCHEEVGKGRRVAHAPLAEGDCTSCHRPHGLVGALRLQAEEPELCLGCHDSKGIGLEAEHLHPDVGQCSECHDPHGSDQPAILKSPGRELCARCHSGSGFAGSFVHAPASDDCLTCHRPHGSGEPALLASPKESLCGTCHDDGDGFAAGHAGLSVSGADCSSCHPPHAAASEGLLRASVHPVLECDTCHEDTRPLVAPPAGAAVCLDCHETPTGGTGSLHPPAAEGDCLTCHDPHTTDTPPLLVSRQAQLCSECHDGVLSALKGEFPHAAAQECTSCHKGHQSDQPKLLVADRRALCLECHVDPMEQGADVVHVPATDDCTECHEPHGSGRRAMLTEVQGELCGACHGEIGARSGLPVLHAPVADGDCVSCHEPHAGAQKLLKDSGQALCAGCHAGMLEARNAQAQHGPFEAGECGSCHRPHAAEWPALLSAPVGVLCRECHDVPDSAPVPGSLHPPSTDACTACHQPHASANSHHLVAPVRPLCVTCHSGIGEQLSTQVVHPPAEEIDGCLTCHGPHSTGSPHLLLASVSETCLGCHDGGSAEFSEKHFGAAADTMDCGGCHDPHASRMAGMLLPEVHMPFADGDCSVCHRPASDKQGGAR